jgi:PhoH-like ATPase
MASKGKIKFFVLDTNVILRDSSRIRQFRDNNIVLPITVLEELDQFKKEMRSSTFTHGSL